VNIDSALTEDKEILKKEIERKKTEDPSGIFSKKMVKYFQNRIK
jgi:hypothetical protein